MQFKVNSSLANSSTHQKPEISFFLFLRSLSRKKQLYTITLSAPHIAFFASLLR
jgi:hypothetical protein